MTTVVGWLAVGTGAVAALAQLVRIVTKGVASVSPTTWSMLVATGCFWTAYGAAVHSTPILVGSALALAPQLAIMNRLKAWSHLSAIVLTCCGVVLFALLPAFLWGWNGAVYGVGVAGSVSRLPQFVDVTFRRDVSGVSASSWTVAFAGSVLWIIYYAGAHLWAVLVVTALAGTMSLSIASVTAWRHQRARFVLAR